MTFRSTRIMALALAGASVIAVATPADAAWRGRNVAIGAGVGLAAGALIGGAIASSAYPHTYGYYGDGYYGGPYQSYGYYGSPYESYGYYEPSTTHYAPAPAYGYYTAGPRYYRSPYYDPNNKGLNDNDIHGR